MPKGKEKESKGIVYSGEALCGAIGKGCTRKAYYARKGVLLCGNHSRSIEREALPKLPKNIVDKRRKDKTERENIVIENNAKENRERKHYGNIVLSRLAMMKNPGDIEGYRKVFPNYKHQNRKDGFGCSSLSPMKLGPVEHGQPDLPPAKNIENFHQGTKCFKEELGKDGFPSPLYYENRNRFYEDEVPHRHKYKGTQKNKDIPEYFYWIDKDGMGHPLSYIKSRQFYCNFYERLASKQNDFGTLLEMYKNGVNLQICGYDAYPSMVFIYFYS